MISMLQRTCTNLFFLRSFLVVIALFFTTTAQANYPNVVGSFTGSVTGEKYSSTPSGIPNFNDTLTIQVTQQSDAAIQGTISFSSLGLSTTFTGYLQDSGATIDVVFQESSTVNAGGGFAGAFNGSQLIIPGLLQMGSLIMLQKSPMQIVETGGTLNFTSNTVINPEESASTAIKDAGTIQTEVNNLVTPVQNHLKNTMRGQAKGGQLNRNGFFFEGEGGLNAGGVQWGNLGVWGSYNYSSSENEFSRTAFESDRHSVVGGVDLSPNDNVVVGLGLSYENSDTDTAFNNGNLQSDGFTLIPYFGLLLSDTFSMDAAMGYSWIENEQYRTAGTTRISSAPESRRFFLSANMNSVNYLNDWIIGGRLGFTHARSSTEAFTESDATAVGKRATRLGQLSVGGDIAYSIRNFEPYISASYQYDYLFEEVTLSAGAQPSNDRDDVLFGTGFRYFSDNGVSASLDYLKRLSRDDYQEDTLNLSIRVDY